MISRFNSLFYTTAWVLTLSIFLMACQDTIPNRATIAQGASQSTGGTSGGTTGGRGPATRPDGAIFFSGEFCGCNNTKAITYGNCSTFCAGKSTANLDTYYASFTVSEAISLSSLGNVANWCTKTLSATDATAPKCVLEATDENGGVTILEPVVVTAGSNSIKATGSLSDDKVYKITLVEQTSGARSNNAQTVKFSADLGIPILGPLKNAPISQYSCIIRNYETDSGTGDIYYTSGYRSHYYFLPRNPPDPLTGGSTNIFCHDIFNVAYGATDDRLYPRLELIEGIFNLWDSSDPRFYDNSGNTNLDVNDLIIQKTRNFGGTINANVNFFLQFKWPNGPTATGTSGSTSSLPLGYYMAPWIDQATFKSYCLNSTYYGSSNPLYRALRDIIGVDTEGLYIGEKAATSVQQSDGTFVDTGKDYLLIRETDLKKVWYYLKNGVPTAPTDAIVSSVAVFFNYPLNITSPFVISSTQKTYQVKGANELNNGSVAPGGSNTAGTSTNYPPHDRKIGCVPKF